MAVSDAGPEHGDHRADPRRSHPPCRGPVQRPVQYLVSRGFDVLTPNYRGSTGFGLWFQETIKEDGWGGREQEDIRYGIEALIRAGVAEPGAQASPGPRTAGTPRGGRSRTIRPTSSPPRPRSAA